MDSQKHESALPGVSGKTVIERVYTVVIVDEMPRLIRPSSVFHVREPIQSDGVKRNGRLGVSFNVIWRQYRKPVTREYRRAAQYGVRPRTRSIHRQTK